MKKVFLVFIYLNLMGSVLSHTGNDAVNHMPTAADWIISSILIVIFAAIIIWLIRKSILSFRKKG